MIKLTKEIAPEAFNWRNDPKVFRWTRQQGLISYSDHLAWLDKITKDKSIMMFGVVATLGPAQGKTVGQAGLTSIRQDHGSAEFSLLIGPEFQGQGYGRATLKELLLYGFDHLRLNTIYGETLVGNPALKMFESLGLTVEGLLKARYFKDGAYQDSIPVSIRKWELK
jgi:RimJ/RimL family protein N-acetyltransferase